MNERIKVLCFLDDDNGRDVEILMPVVYFAEKYMNCEVEFVFVWDIHAIYRKKPDMVLLPNTIGSLWYFQISKYAYEQGVKVFALLSEGNFRTDNTFNYWGYNYDKKFYEEFICLWSKRTYDYFIDQLPDYNNKIVFTGATGYDRYLIYKFQSKEVFLKLNSLEKFNKVICYAGWAFGKLFNEQGLQELRFFHKDDTGRLKWVEDQMYFVEDILKNTIENNPDILFLFKRHPNEANPSIIKECMNEMIRLRDYPNVLYITENIGIHDLVSISDIWMAFDTTSVIDAWLLNEKQTILINPDPVFRRSGIEKGSVIVENFKELQNFINEYYETGIIKGFMTNEKKQNRKQLIKDTIGFGDGLNHLRTGYYLKKVVQEIRSGGQAKRYRFSRKYFIRYAAIYITRFFYIRSLFSMLPKFKKTVWIFERYKLKKLPLLKDKYYKYLDEFYKKNSLKSKIENNSIWDEIIDSS